MLNLDNNIKWGEAHPTSLSAFLFEVFPIKNLRKSKGGEKKKPSSITGLAVAGIQCVWKKQMNWTFPISHI